MFVLIDNIKWCFYQLNDIWSTNISGFIQSYLIKLSWSASKTLFIEWLSIFRNFNFTKVVIGNSWLDWKSIHPKIQHCNMMPLSILVRVRGPDKEPSSDRKPPPRRMSEFLLYLKISTTLRELVITVISCKGWIQQ